MSARPREPAAEQLGSPEAYVDAEAAAVGATVRRGLNFVLDHGSARCDVLRYAAIYQQTIPIAADSLNVTRIDARTWEVSTQPAPNDRAYCTTTGESFSMPIRFRVIADSDLAH